MKILQRCTSDRVGGAVAWPSPATVPLQTIRVNCYYIFMLLDHLNQDLKLDIVNKIRGDDFNLKRECWLTRDPPRLNLFGWDVWWILLRDFPKKKTVLSYCIFHVWRCPGKPHVSPQRPLFCAWCRLSGVILNFRRVIIATLNTWKRLPVC